jgi:hypothetical protein
MHNGFLRSKATLNESCDVPKQFWIANKIESHIRLLLSRSAIESLGIEVIKVHARSGSILWKTKIPHTSTEAISSKGIFLVMKMFIYLHRKLGIILLASSLTFGS